MPSPYTPEIFDYDKLYQLLINQGATPSEASTLAAIAMAESGGNPGAKNDTSIESSYGLFQINLDAHPDVGMEQAGDPVFAADYALQMFRQQGGKPWTMYNNGQYQNYLPGGDTGSTTPTPYPPTSGIDLENFQWPDASLGMTADYIESISSIASIFAAAGMPLPAGAPSIATAMYQATLTELAKGGQTPEQKAQAQADLATTLQQYMQSEQLFPLTMQEIQQKIARGEALLPLEIQQLEQAIRLAEPIGAEKIISTEGGAAGFRDYWSRKGLDESRKNDPDYLAGFNLAKQEGDPERRQSLIDYINTVISTVTTDIAARGLQVSEASAEFARHMDAFAEAGQQYEDMFKWSIPEGVEYVPGFEPEGFATSLGMQSWKATPTHFDPFQMAQDILNKTPSPAAIGAPQVPETDWSGYQDAYNQLKGFLGEENM